MQIAAGDINSRVRLVRLLEKVNANPEYSRKIGVEDVSYFRSIPSQKKDEGKQL